jgi:hypothetical protein
LTTNPTLTGLGLNNSAEEFFNLKCFSAQALRLKNVGYPWQITYIVCQQRENMH